MMFVSGSGIQALFRRSYAKARLVKHQPGAKKETRNKSAGLLMVIIKNNLCFLQLYVNISI